MDKGYGSFIGVVSCMVGEQGVVLIRNDYINCPVDCHNLGI